MARFLTIAAALALAGCGSGDNQPGPGGVTVGEARALDEAAEMIEQRRPPSELQGVAPQGEQPAQPDTSRQ
jgi:hypothetical protein